MLILEKLVTFVIPEKKLAKNGTSISPNFRYIF